MIFNDPEPMKLLSNESILSNLNITNARETPLQIILHLYEIVETSLLMTRQWGIVAFPAACSL